MNWMKTNFRFDVPMVTFTASMRQLEHMCQIRDIVRDNQDDLERLAAKLTDLVEFFYPELKGGIIVSIDMGFGSFRWKIAYAPPSLPRVSMCQEPEERDLIPPGFGESGVDPVRAFFGS